MSYLSFFGRLAATATLAASVLISPLASALEPAPNSYVTLGQAVPSDSVGKVEVLEFFAYSCPHCAVMEPLVDKWASTLGDDVVLKRVPVAFNAGMGDLQRAYFVLEALDRLDLHPKLFAAIHQEKRPVFDKKAIRKWAESEGIEGADFDSAFDSFGVQTKANRANDLIRLYQIQGTPSLAIGGKYVTSPAYTNSYEDTLRVAEALIKQSQTH
ncbi:MAG TPA: thiol:disulfide interchange protein DsbA/DsbL [Paenalcaligenes hominis]|uniref:Thiol:disulfide interchange protein n=1 Tax=Paenalcaligenes hominis TaxID=643674 RepID=A0A9D3AAX5_9BURK|nr:thiol:disulfide interchange protein DsbA/DsbL [Paenalcaligenes hominis]